MSRPRKVTADDVARAIVALDAECLSSDAESVAAQLGVSRSTIDLTLRREIGESFSVFRRRFRTFSDAAALLIDDDDARQGFPGMGLSAGAHRWLVRRAAARRVSVGVVIDELVGMARDTEDRHDEAA